MIDIEKVKKDIEIDFEFSLDKTHTFCYWWGFLSGLYLAESISNEKRLELTFYCQRLSE